MDAVYLGADSWDSTNDFVLDNAKFPDPKKMATTLNGNNQRLVAYVDAAVNVKDRTKNAVYKSGKNVDGFIKSNINQGNPDGYLVNQKQGKNVVYVDWLNPKAQTFWSNQVQGYQQNVNFDGLWTTMNEPFGDVSGEISQESAKQQTPERLLEAIQADSPRAIVKDGGEESPYDQSWFYSFWPLNKISTYFLPFIPRLADQGNYDANTLSLNATHANGVSDYDVHSLYPLGMAKATVNGLQGDARPFMLTKGSFSGISSSTGSTAHTNNKRSWDSLYFGLASVLRSQMFGLPHSGSDVCGYYAAADGTLDEELCLRWY